MLIKGYEMREEENSDFVSWDMSNEAIKQNKDNFQKKFLVEISNYTVCSKFIIFLNIFSELHECLFIDAIISMTDSQI